MLCLSHISLSAQVPVMFIQCRGPEARTAASFSISRQRETVDSTDADDGDADDGAVSRNGSSSRNGRRSSSSSSAVDGSSPGDGAGDSGGAGGYSYFNAAEADVVVRCLQQLLGAGMQPEDMCVITPYRCVWLSVSVNMRVCVLILLCLDCCCMQCGLFGRQGGA